jgi:hypothetical protein
MQVHPYGCPCPAHGYGRVDFLPSYGKMNVNPEVATAAVGGGLMLLSTLATLIRPKKPGFSTEPPTYVPPPPPPPPPPAPSPWPWIVGGAVAVMAIGATVFVVTRK